MEPGGIGPDLILGLAAQDWPVELVVVADPALLSARAELLDLAVELQPYQPERPFAPSARGTSDRGRYPAGSTRRTRPTPGRQRSCVLATPWRVLLLAP